MKYFDYKEHKQHGTFDFPMEFYYVSENDPRYDMHYHWHIECEIIRILEGEFLILINDEKVLAKKGDVIFIHDGILHGGTPKNCIYECIVFDMKLLLKENNICTKQLQDIINHNKIVVTKLNMDIKDLKVVCDYLFKVMKEKANGYELFAQGCLYQFFGAILKYNLYINNNKITKRSAQKILQFKNTLDLIENEYSNSITLQDLSKAAGMNSKYFCRFFYEMSNKTPIEYLNYYRIESACERLLTTDLPITEIAFSCGFNDVSYFIKSFKKHKGITPKQYVKNFLVDIG